jgi:Tol biopolymer transport system component
MGEVYRATDTRLGRDVAIKVLPAEVTGDPERLARFEREARLLAALNHPNIATLHGLEEASGRPFLVLELVEGEDLAERLKRFGAFPVGEVVAIARQIAEALEEAHEKGIVHRDLKPANVKLTPDGKVKVLDFGLAKAWAGEAASSPSADSSRSPTLAHTGTAAGLLLGTAAYMSPEQARGKTVDKRADIWAFGALLFEMLTGRPLFSGETVSDILAAVLRQDVDWRSLPPQTPPTLRRLLRRCLERETTQRLRDIGEARILISRPGEMDTSEGGARAAGRPSAPRLMAAALAGALVAAGFGALWVQRRDEGRLERRPTRRLVLAAEGRTTEDGQAISPDGRWVAYTAAGRLWLRNLAELEPREVAGSEGAVRPFWSPRSDAVAYATQARLFKVPVESGRAVELCELSGGEFTGGAWSASEGIVVTLARGNWSGDVLRVPEDGGRPEEFTRAAYENGELRLADPHFLPDGRTLLFSVVTRDEEKGEIVVHKQGLRTRLGLGEAGLPVYSPTRHLFFLRGSRFDYERSLWAVSFSLDSLAPMGEAFRLAPNAWEPSVSRDGTLVYGRTRPVPQQLVWVDRYGRVVGTIGEAERATVLSPAVSPDGRRVVAALMRVGGGLWVWDTDRGVGTRLTGDSKFAFHPTWSPSGDEIVYMLDGGQEGLLVRRADGSDEARTLVARKEASGAHWSRDGGFLAFYVVDRETARDLWAVAGEESAEPFPVLRTPANEAMPRISPEGGYVAYQSDASGRWEIYMQPFPKGEGRRQVSVDGGKSPIWNPQGGELFFVAGNDLMAVSVTLRPEVRIGSPRRLFSGEDIGTNLSIGAAKVDVNYDVAPDGKRFVVVRGTRMGTSEVVLVEGELTRPRPDAEGSALP